jgi:CDP-ribitol ribitolphosphotransferase
VGDIATHARSVRFNVFAGPGRAPLSTGRWNVAIRQPSGAWSFIPANHELGDPGELSRDFVYPGGMYRVVLRASEPTRWLFIQISVWEPSSVARKPLVRRLRDGWKRIRRRGRQRLFAALVRLTRAVTRHGRRRVVFTSDSRETLGGNLRLVHDRMVARGLDRQLTLQSIFKPSIRTRRTFLDRLRMVWLFASADVILLDDYQPAVSQLGVRDDVRIIQLWHAWGAFKTVGYSRVGKPGGLSPYSRVHRNYTYAVVSSAHEVPFYAEAFGIPEERVIPTGIPRMDEFLDPARQAVGRARAFATVPSARHSETILFAPTFRGAGARQAYYPVEQIDFGGLAELCRERDAVLVFKMHPFVRRALEIPDAYRDRLFDATVGPADVNDLLLIADLLVTDYSSLIFEFATLGRPMLFFAFDLERYMATRDFYEPFADFVPGRIVRSSDELLDAIRRQQFEIHKVAPFARRHLPATAGSATDRIIDELILPS